MKRLLLISSIAFGLLSVSAQTISVTVEGKPVQNGSTVDSKNVTVDEGTFTMPDGTVIPYSDYTLDPEVVATSSSNGTFTITVTNNTVEDFAPGVLFCWPSTCETVSKGSSASQTGTLTANQPSELKIDAAWDEFIPNDFTLPCKIEIVENGNPSNSFTFNLNMIYVADEVSVESIIDNTNLPSVYYDLTGRKVLNPAKGQIVIERKGSNAKKVIF